MTAGELRAAAGSVKRQYRAGAVTEGGLRRAIRDRGFTVVEFLPDGNPDDVDQIISSLDLLEYVDRCLGFTYSDAAVRLVFVRADLSPRDKTIVLAHEAGHIVCGHITAHPVCGSSAAEELEASEFAGLVLRESRLEKIRYALSAHRTAVLSAVAAAALLAGLLCWVLHERNERLYYGEYYITEHGGRYHNLDCRIVRDRKNIRRMTVEEYQSGEYTPCHVCLP